LIVRYLQITSFSLCLALCTTRRLRAQDFSPALNVAASEANAPDIGDPPLRRFPLDVAGYLSFRALNDDALSEHNLYREYAASIFVSKKIGQWQFHSEFNATSASEFNTEGIHIVPRSANLDFTLETASVNYNWRDWLQVEAGFLFIPTYWRTHRYQSTNLTVDEPLMDQNVFPTAFKGGMLHGDRYFEHGGLSYIIYGGISQEPEIFTVDKTSLEIDRARAIGGKLVAHVPTGRFFDALDIGYHRLEQRFDDRDEHLDGAELRLEKGRIQVLGEFAHMSAIPSNGQARFFRQGYYIQPSYRITRQLFAVGNYDWLNRDSRYAAESGLARQSVGLTYRPLTSLSLKIEADRYQPDRGRQPAYYGASVGVVYFFHLP
jgi:hypothetical protein